MKSKLLVMIADNITAADVSSIDDISFLSFDGNRSMPISDKKSLDKAIGHIRDFYNVETFEDDTDVVIVYDKLSSEMIEYFAGSFVGCDKLGVIPFANIIPEIIRNRKTELPAVLTFDHSSFSFGETESSQPAHIDVELNDLLFLYYVAPDYFSDVSSTQLDELMQQLEASNKEKKELNEKVSVLSEQVKKLGASLSQKIEEAKKLESSLKHLEGLAEAENARRKLLAERSIVYADIPDDIWNAYVDWNNDEYIGKISKAYLYLFAPKLSGDVVSGEKVTSFFWSFSRLEKSELLKNQSVNLSVISEIFEKNSSLSFSHLTKSAFGVAEKARPVARKSIDEKYLQNKGIKASYINDKLIVFDYKVNAEKSGKLFRLLKETDVIKTQNQAIAVIGNENDTREDIDKWLAEIGRSDLKCVR